MSALILIAWLSLPIAPLNPIEQDTIAALNFHVTAGVTSPNGVISAGPEISAKLEYRPFHPFIFRAESSVRAGTIGTRFFPIDVGSSGVYLTGEYQSLTTAADVLYYRGTDRLTAYLGVGMVYGFHRFNPDSEVMGVLVRDHGIVDVDMQQKLGYRLTFGVRYNRLYSFEIGIMEIKPNFIFGRRYGDEVYSLQRSQTRFSGFRFTLGYILPIRDL